MFSKVMDFFAEATIKVGLMLGLMVTGYFVLLVITLGIKIFS